MKNHLSKFHYSNIQKHQHGTKKTIRKVIIKNGKGYKSISIYKNGKLTKTIKRPLMYDHVCMIKDKKFIPGLFADCKTRKHRK